MSAPSEEFAQNAAWAPARPVISVLIPFYRDNPTPLLRALDNQAAALDGKVEIICLDDGSGDPVLAGEVSGQVKAMEAPARMVGLSQNVGRAKARNRLGRHARGDYLLFVDGDMRPDQPDFLLRWLELARNEAPAVACGGFYVDGSPARPETALHRAMARRSECLPAGARSRAPSKYVFTNNLLVRRDVFEAEPFDEGFVGWGWEDVEWGVRVSRRWPIMHVDNRVQNCGLSSVDALIGKYQQAAPNFARMLRTHPDVVATFPTFHAARALKALPLRRVWLQGLSSLARSASAPMRLRELALKGYRAGLYAEVL